MAYNKSRAEQEWVAWKQQEEEILRELGFCEDAIQQLHADDWERFKSDRRFYERREYSVTEYDPVLAQMSDVEPTTIEQLLDNIEDERIFKIMMNTDVQTLLIVLCRINGYRMRDISHMMQLSGNAVSMRIWRLRGRLKRILG